MILRSDFKYPLKVCNFHASIGHLLTTIIPYSSNIIDNEGEVLLITQQDIGKYINKYSSSYNFSINTAKFNHFYINDIFEQERNDEISNNLLNITQRGENNEVAVIIQGAYEYCKHINDVILDKFIKNKIIVVDCYEVFSSKKYLKEIVKDHKYLLNSTGIHTIEEIYFKTENKMVM